ncbi:MAG TPA: hypothetical protein VHP11_10305 [Tepidisphaeraceae bacterium]|nr:hypothetical protein [Tepidisphaeraceae bacterium]
MKASEDEGIILLLNRAVLVADVSRRFVSWIGLLILVAGVSVNALAQTIEIRSIEQLASIGKDPQYPLNGSYLLTHDIDASVTSGWYNGGFRPIGSSNTPFTGTFDGQGHVISRLTIKSSLDDGTGMFARLAPGGQIKNVGLQGTTVTGVGTAVGCLVGENWGTVASCHLTGANNISASGAGSLFATGLGGLIGDNVGVVSQCYAAGVFTFALTNVDGFVGCLIGCNADGETTQCYATDRLFVTGSGGGDSTHIGGLMGANFGILAASYASVSMTCELENAGGLATGGLVAYNAGKITRCYASGEGAFCGLLWNNDGDTVESSYWDTEASHVTLSGGGTGEPTAAMMTQSTFAGWDFQYVWSISEGESYPLLRLMPPSVPLVVGMTQSMAEAALRMVLEYLT